jgi:hypothetical protein
MVAALKMAAGILGIIIIVFGLYLIVLSITYFLSPQGPYLASGVMSMTGGIVLLFMGAYVINKIRWKRR